MTRLEALEALHEKVEAGTARQDDFTEGFPGDWPRDALRAYHDHSLDAAKALHEALLPGTNVRILDHGAEYEDVGRWAVKVNWEHTTWQPTFTAAGPFGHEGQCNDPARAWLLAILNALIAQEERP